jgi:hypothetical protein
VAEEEEEAGPSLGLVTPRAALNTKNDALSPLSLSEEKALLDISSIATSTVLLSEYPIRISGT